MHGLTLSVAVATFATLAAAQSFATGGQGRFPCTTNADCAAGAIGTFGQTITPGCGPDGSSTVDGNNFKGYGPIPSGSVCVPAEAGGGSFCGIAGAACSTSAQCDNGSCGAGGVCTGGLGTACTLDSECTGNIYCLDPSGDSTGANVCGFSDSTTGTGALCDDGCAAGNFLCLSGACDGNSGTCFPTLVGASQRARARRNTLTVRGQRCPESHSACPLAGSSKGFECIDTSSNLEQCGACASAGGVDCTQLPGVDAVGCVAGQCEIWSCAEGFAWDSAASSCVLGLQI